MMDEMESLRKQTSQMGSALGGITKNLGKVNLGPKANANSDMFDNLSLIHI